MTVTPDVCVSLISKLRCLPIIVAFGTQMKFMYLILFLLKIISEKSLSDVFFKEDTLLLSLKNTYEKMNHSILKI